MDKLKEIFEKIKPYLGKKSVVIAVAVLVVLVILLVLVNGMTSSKTEDETDSASVNSTTGFSSDVVRITGSSVTTGSLETAKTLLKVSGMDSFDTVIITSDQSIADALSGTYLATVKSAPILILSTDTSGAVTDTSVSLIKSYISSNLSETGSIIILGGVASVPEDVEATLSELGTVTRIAEEDRYATNLAVLNEAGTAGINTLLVSSGVAFADSISAASTGLPILLVGDELTYEQRAYISEHDFDQICVLGGSVSVSDDVMDTLERYCSDVERISGDSRYATSKAIADKFFTGATTVCTTCGDGFAAGLAAGPVANLLNAPILLVADDFDSDAKAFISANNVTSVITFATAEEISDDLMNGLK